MLKDEDQSQLDLAKPAGEAYDFHIPPIKGYPELRWNGKRPFQGTHFYPAQLKESHGAEVKGWRNRIYWGDNLQIMSHLLKEFRSKVDLAYIDPPFDSKAEYKKKIRIRGEDLVGEVGAFEEKQYTDIWTNDQYLQYMHERITIIKELLSSNGTLVVHADSSRVHQLRCIIDEILGEKKFRNEIIWHYENKLGTGGNTIDSRHDTLLVYCKGDAQTYNPILLPVKNVKLQPVTQKIDGKRVWLKDANGKNLYQESSEHRPLGDVWNIPIINPVSNERTGYPTQKPEKLLEAIIGAWSNFGDLVFDGFMGSGTTQAVAMKLGRRFIGADINLGAVQTTTKRLLKVAAELDQKQAKLVLNTLKKANDNESEEGKPAEPTIFYTGFEVYNVNHYDVFRNPAQAKDLLIEALEIQPLAKSSVYDGEKDGRMVKIMPVNRIATKADLNELIAGFDWKGFERRKQEHPNRSVENVLLVCMGHEPDLAAALKKEVWDSGRFEINVEVVDILRDKSNLEFKRDAEADVTIEDDKLVIRAFYPMNLLQKLSLMKEQVDDWRELVESVMVDWNY